MRLFFAIPVSGPVREIVRGRIHHFPVEDPPWRWIDPGNYHLTMKFLGEVDEDRIPGLCKAAGLAVAGIEPFRIAFGPFGGFPSLSRPRVLFFGIKEGVERMRSLAVNLEDELEKLGFVRERKPFRAHLTLARIKRALPRSIVTDLEAIAPLPAEASQEADRLELVRSRLSPSGATYSSVATVTFRSGD